jgi:hypothetical protein
VLPPFFFLQTPRLHDDGYEVNVQDDRVCYGHREDPKTFPEIEVSVPGGTEEIDPYDLLDRLDETADDHTLVGSRTSKISATYRPDDENDLTVTSVR